MTNQFGQPGGYSAAITAKTLEEAEQRLKGSPQPAQAEAPGQAGAAPQTRRKFPAEAYRIGGPRIKGKTPREAHRS